MDQQHIPDPFREGRLRLPQGTPDPLAQPAPVPQPAAPPDRQKSQGCNRRGCSCLVLLLGLVAAVGSILAVYGEQARKFFEEELSRMNRGVVVAPSFDSNTNFNDHPPVLLGDLNDDGIEDLATVGSVVQESQVRPQAIALSGSDGRQLWTAILPGNDNIGYLVAGGAELLAIRGRSISSLDQHSGAVRWTRELPDTVEASDDSPALFAHAGYAVVRTKGDRLSGIELRNGRVAWERMLTELPSVPPQQLGGSICVEGRRNMDAWLQCYAIDTGRAGARINLSEWPDVAVWWVHNDAARPAVYRLWDRHTGDHQFERLTPAGEVLSQHLVEGSFSSILVRQNRVLTSNARIVLNMDDRLVLLNTRDPSQIRTFRLEGSRLFPAAVDGALLYAIAVRQRGTAIVSVVGVDLETGRLRWQTPQLGPHEGVGTPGGADWQHVPGRGLLGVWKDGEHDYQTHVGLVNQQGEMVWEQALGSGSLSGPSAFSYDKRSIYLADNSFLAAIDLQDGAVRWQLGKERR